MEDISPGLLNRIRADFIQQIENSPTIKALYEAIQSGNASYIQAEDYAYEVGAALSESFGKYLSSAVLPDGKMYFNIAESVVRPLLVEDHSIIADAAAQVQNSLNKKAGINIKAQTVPVNDDRITGIVDKISDADTFDDVAWVLDEPIKNFSMNVVDEVLRANVDFQGKAGLRPKIIRRAERKCCSWCAKLAGVYDYPVGREVYQRHERCRCTVDYDPGSGKRQNVHTKQWTDPEESVMIEKRKIIGLRANNVSVSDISQHEYERFAERNVTIEAVKDAIEHPLKTEPVKYDADGRPSFKMIGKKATISVNPETGVIVTAYPTHTKTAQKLMGRK